MDRWITHQLYLQESFAGSGIRCEVGADLYSMSARAAYESGKSPETLAGRDAWYRSEEERLAAGIAKGADNWKPTGGFVAPGVIDNGDGTYRPNDIYINPEDYWMSVCVMHLLCLFTTTHT